MYRKKKISKRAPASEYILYIRYVQVHVIYWYQKCSDSCIKYVHVHYTDNILVRLLILIIVFESRYLDECFKQSMVSSFTMYEVYFEEKHDLNIFIFQFKMMPLPLPWSGILDFTHDENDSYGCCKKLMRISLFYWFFCWMEDKCKRRIVKWRKMTEFWQ